MRDFTELALAADELPVAIWMGRVPGGEVVYTNAAFREVLGIDPPEGAGRGGFAEPYGVHTSTGAPYPEDRMPFERVLAARAPVVLDDLVIHRRDGRKVNLRVFAKPIFDADGNLTHVLEAFTDITREVEAERARAEGQRRLARSERLDSIGQLVTGIAHDFNNLLTVTKLGVSWLLATEQRPDRHEALVQIGTVTDSGIELIKNLLGFARPEKRVNVPVSIDAAAKPVLEMAARTFDRSITVRSELSSDGALILGDRSEVQQLIMNLVLNARDAVAGKGEVVLRTRVETVAAGEARLAEGSRCIVIEVADTGSGIDPAIRERIFEPYFTTKTQGPVKGTGLGLGIVHGIVTAHGGWIDVDDNAPRGTIMRVHLPIQHERSCAPGERPDRASTPEGPLPSGDGRLIIVVDDEPLVRASTSASLRALGFRVCEAADGAAAIETFARMRQEVTAVVLDMVMPGLRGTEVYRALRKLRADLPILLVTGCPGDDEARADAELAIVGWLQKPYDDRQLVAGLRDAGAF